MSKCSTPTTCTDGAIRYEIESGAGHPGAVERLEQAADAYARAHERVDSVGADALRDCRDIYRELWNLLEIRGRARAVATSRRSWSFRAGSGRD